VRVHSLTLFGLFALPGACDVTPGSTTKLATLQPPLPWSQAKARVATLKKDVEGSNEGGLTLVVHTSKVMSNNSITNQKPTIKKDKRKDFCNYCKKPRHWAQECKKKVVEGTSQKNGFYYRINILSDNKCCNERNMVH